MLFSCMFFSFKTGSAQDIEPLKHHSKSRVVFFVGPSVSYFKGVESDSYNEFDRNRLNYQINAFMGYLSTRNGVKNSFGVFGATGYTNAFTLDEIISIQEVVANNLTSTNYNTFYQVEVGVIVSNFLRFSTGIGNQQYKSANIKENLEYLSSTAGIVVDFGSVLWCTDANINYGRDYSNTVIKFSTSLVVAF